MKFEPPLDFVVVERELIFESPQGIRYKEPLVQWYGKIIAVGPGMLRTMPIPAGIVVGLDPNAQVDLDHYPMQYKVGDLVICPPGMNAFPDEVPVPRKENTQLFVCSERQLLCKFIPEEGDAGFSDNGKA